MQFTILLTAFLPYCSLVLRLPGDVQPWAALLSWMYWLILTQSQDWKAKLNRWDVVLFSFCIFFLLYIYTGGEVSAMTYLRKTMVFLLSIAILWSARYFRISYMRQALTFATCAYLFFAVLQYVSTGAYVALAGLLTRLKDVNIGNRGAASLAPEATDFGLTMVYVILFALILKARDPAPSRFLGFDVYKAIIVMGVACIVLSRSGTGFIGVTVVGGLAFLSQTHKKRYAIAAVGVICALIVGVMALPASVVQNVRGLQLLFAVFSGIDFLFATSFAHRSIHNIVSFISLYETYGLGHGAGSFTIVAPEIYDRYGLATQFGMSSWHQGAVRTTLGTGALAVTALLITEFGAVGILFIVIIFAIVRNSRLPYRGAIMALMAMTWLQSFPAAYPMFWILVGLARNPIVSSADLHPGRRRLLKSTTVPVESLKVP